ncbi:MAG: hemolysin III family protein [Clostridia bacterium]|nr:hemolysin III family protein [Clostridia bacterium]
MSKYEKVKFREREMPDYTKGEEIFNMVSHIVGAAFGVVALVLTVVFSAIKGDAWAVVSSAIYGATMVMLYTVSSVYHGLHMNMGKRVMQVIDHCTIFLLIAGTYTPVALCPIREYSTAWGWVLFGVVWGCAALGITFTAIDMKRYSKLAMVFYLGMGWCVVMAAKPTLASVPLPGLAWILAGGIAYTIGAVLYGLGKKRRYMHSIFHLFVVAGSILQFFGIFFYIVL